MEKFIYSTGKQRCLESKQLGSIGSIGEGGWGHLFGYQYEYSDEPCISIGLNISIGKNSRNISVSVKAYRFNTI